MNPQYHYHISTRRRHWSAAFDFLLFAKDDNKIIIPQLTHPATAIDADAFGIIDTNDPTFVLGHHEAQELIDQLYAAGLRPTNATDNAGIITAKDNHIADLRTLLFSKPVPTCRDSDRV